MNHYTWTLHKNLNDGGGHELHICKAKIRMANFLSSSSPFPFQEIAENI